MTTIKSLEWRDVRGDGSLYAGTDIGLAYIASEKAWGFRNYPDQYPVQGGIEAAKSAAFADYSARIMSAIEPAGVGVETASHKALKAWEAWEAKLIMEGSDQLWCELGDLSELQALRNAAFKGDEQ